VKGDLFPPVFPAMELLSPPHYFDSNYNESSYLKLDGRRAARDLHLNRALFVPASLHR
jgi:hypothetical protein